jgi:hypothetical protein
MSWATPPHAEPAMKQHRRTLKLILPRLQLRLILVFLCTAASALLLQYLLLMETLADFAADLPHDGLLLLDGLGELLTRILVASFLVLLPLTFLVGILATHRFAGPIYKLQNYLHRVAQGERLPDCQLRKGDELQDLCDLVNRATAPVRDPKLAAAKLPDEPVGVAD